MKSETKRGDYDDDDDSSRVSFNSDDDSDDSDAFSDTSNNMKNFTGIFITSKSDDDDNRYDLERPQLEGYDYEDENITKMDTKVDTKMDTKLNNADGSSSDDSDDEDSKTMMMMISPEIHSMFYSSLDNKDNIDNNKAASSSTNDISNTISEERSAINNERNTISEERSTINDERNTIININTKSTTYGDSSDSSSDDSDSDSDTNYGSNMMAMLGINLDSPRNEEIRPPSFL